MYVHVDRKRAGERLSSGSWHGTTTQPVVKKREEEIQNSVFLRNTDRQGNSHGVM